MKIKLLLIMLLYSCVCNAQDYRCFQAGVDNFFINSHNYLRGIRIDSTTIAGDSTIYYPFRTPRGSYAGEMAIPPIPISLDTNGGSWLGKIVIARGDGSYIFDNYWSGDTIVIKTKADVGDSWVFYGDTDKVHYIAAVTTIDTMTVLSVIDSIKIMQIKAYDSATYMPTDPLNNLTIVLSKSHGFVQVFDLYMFPYHEPDSVFKIGNDYFMDRSLCTIMQANGTPSSLSYPNGTNALFRLTNFINPNDHELYN